MSNAEILKRLLEEAKQEVNDWPDSMKKQEPLGRLSSSQNCPGENERGDRPQAKCS
jgi:hypothetical protein